MNTQIALTRFWDYITRPHPSITDIEQRRQSKLLAGLILALIIMSLFASILLITRNEGVISNTTKFLWAALGLTLVLYFLNRNGRYQLSAYGFVGYNFFVVYAMPIITEDASWLWFAMMTLLLSAMLLPALVTTAVFVAGLLAQLAHGIFYPLASEYTNFTTTVVYTVIAPLVLVFMNHRIQVERERQHELRMVNKALEESEAQLEKRVVERTRDLKVASDVARQITTVLDLDQLLPQLVEKTKMAFDLYFVSIFLYHPESQQLIVAAGTGQAGQQMLAEGRAFFLEARPSLMAKAARERQAVVVNDVNQDEAHANNPYLPQTQSEAALPMIIGDELIGALGLQSEVRERFTPDDVEIFGILTEQIAIAVKNARLYKEQIHVAQQLREADRIKNQFLSSMTHELRTPLNAILNFTEMVAFEMMGPLNEEQKDLLNNSLSSSKHLLGLINDVLDISKIQAGRLMLLVEDDVNLQQEMETVLEMTQTLLRDKPVRIVQDIDDNLPFIPGDKRRIRQIFINLLANAIKFTEQGTITLSAKHRGDEVLFAVIDTGPGIAESLQAIIFEPFVQTEAGIKHAEGTGLGLPITKSLVEAHHGRLWVDSEVGQGAAFYVTLPVQNKHQNGIG